jgi:hypothetical protein
MLRNGGLISERPWKAFGAFSIFHARSVGIFSTARVMDHVFLNQLQKAQGCQQEMLKTEGCQSAWACKAWISDQET